MSWFRISATMRIAIGLAFISATIVVGILLCGVIPDQREAAMNSRVRLCENIAVSVSIHATDHERERMKAIVQHAVSRNDDVLSGAVRSVDGGLIVEVGDHAAQWNAELADTDLDQQVVVSIVTGQQQKWGALEMRFVPLLEPGWAGYWHLPAVRLMTLIPATTLLLSFVYLRRMLQHLDPSKAVPSHVKAALDSLAEGLLVIDKKERVVFANQVFASWLDVTSDRLIGKRVGRLPWHDPNKEDNPTATFPWTKALDVGEPQVGYDLILPDGTNDQRALVANASPVLGPRGEHSGVLATFEDVTEREAHRVELHDAKEAAEQANRAKSDFLARMSHEIRSPMNAILGFADVLRRGMDQSPEDRQTYVETIHSSGGHLLALINDILDLSKIESGRMELEMAPCSPHQILSQVVSVLSVKASEKGIALKFQWDGKAPETILSDEVRFRQSIMNLVGNAIKFTEKGEVRIVARLLKRDRQLVVDVVDTGMGIDPAAVDKIFDPFAQADTSVTRRFGGTGLGLAICRQLAEAMGGHVSVHSELGKGSTFTLTVDTGSLKDVRIVDPEELGEIGHRKAVQPQLALPPANVLVVDDSDVNRDLVSLILTRAGVSVDTATNGREAVEKVTNSPYDVVFMDMQMPVMDGYAATAQLREAGITTPIVALTAHAMQGDEAKCRNAGCSAFLTKPLNMDRVIELMQELLGTGTPAEAAAAAAVQPEATDASCPAADSESAIEECALANIAETIDELTELMPGSCDDADSEDLDVAQPAHPAIVGNRLPPPKEVVDLEPLESALPIEDPDFRAIVVKFKQRLDEQVAEMLEAFHQGDFDQLATLSHTLKGTGGCAGFPAFGEPAAQLEHLANAKQAGKIEAAIETIDRLRRRIVISSPDALTS